MNHKALIFLVVAFPMILMAGWVASVEWGLRSGTEVELPIEGYDPRDLLSGHYLIYSVNFGKVMACDELVSYSKGQERCVCLEKRPTGALWEATQSIDCKSRNPDSCPVFLKGTCAYRRFEAGIERFYFSERLTSQLARVPPGASIRVRVNKNGTGLVKDLLIDGRPFQEALNKP